MISKSEIKYYSSLNIKKYRDIEGKFLIEGLKQVEEGISSNWVCDTVLLTKEFEEKYPGFLKKLLILPIEVKYVRSSDFARLADTKSPQGVAAVFNMREVSSFPKILPKFLVAVENISDPGNLGTIIRTCDWFGFQNIILSQECAEIFNPKVIRSSMGSLFHVNSFYAEDFYATINDFKKEGYKILCADLNGRDYSEFIYPSKCILVLSSESHGPSEKLLKLCDDVLTIKKQGKAESLNVASAAAILISDYALRAKN